MIDRRKFIKGSSMAAVGALTVGCSNDAGSTKLPTVSGNSKKLLVNNTDPPKPSTIDRLPLEWHKGRVKVLQQKLGEKGLDGILITDRWNLIYYTGLFHSTTERPFSCFIPTDKMAIHWFYPGLDLEIVKSWWITDGEYYYDYPHHDGAYPDQGKVSIGPPVDLVKWQLTGIKKRGYGSKNIGLSATPSYKTLKHMQNILPKASFEDVSDVCVKMRRVKTDEELALTQRVYNYFSDIHAWTRDYILQYGTDLTDFKVKMAAMEYGTDLIMKDIKRDGHPHTAVGVRVGIGCRSGIGNAYPHPNQFHHNKIKKGDSLQVSGVVRIGGQGGELYCPYQIAPWTSEMEKMWEVMAESSQMQIRMSSVGTRCQDIAKAVHEYQLQNGMQKFLYQRVAHGEGMEGHQEPYIALGDETVLEKNMTFSMEPGLFYPKGGYGYNPSDMVVVAEGTGYNMGRVPNLTKEWAVLKL